MKENGDSGVNPPSFKPQQYQTPQNQEQAKTVTENDWRSVDKPKATNAHGNRDNFKPDTVHNVHNSNHNINNKIGDDVKKRQKDHREVQDNRRRRTPQNPNDHRRRHESPKDKPRERERVERVREKCMYLIIKVFRFLTVLCSQRKNSTSRQAVRRHFPENRHSACYLLVASGQRKER